MLTTNTVGQLLRMQNRRTIHGKEIYDPAVPIPCSVVLLADKVVESSVRADSTASRGSAEQEELQAKILVPWNLKIRKGDVIKILGRVVEVSSLHPRNDVFGRPHHIEVGGNIKGDL